MAAHGEAETLSYFDEGRTLLVNNYTSLAICHQTLQSQTSLGVDLEGRLRVGGSINLIQIGCADSTVFVIDVYQIDVVDKDEHLRSLLQSVLRQTFLNDSVRKVFFDGKRDLEALHFVVGVGTRNFVDAQALHMALF